MSVSGNAWARPASCSVGPRKISNRREFDRAVAEQRSIPSDDPFDVLAVLVADGAPE